MFAFKVFFLTPPRFDVIKVAELGNRTPNVPGICNARVHACLGSHHVLGRVRGDRGDHPRRHKRGRPRRAHGDARGSGLLWRLWRSWRQWRLRLDDNSSWWPWRSRLNSRWFLTRIRRVHWIGGFRSWSTFFAHVAQISPRLRNTKTITIARWNAENFRLQEWSCFLKLNVLFFHGPNIIIIIWWQPSNLRSGFSHWSFKLLLTFTAPLHGNLEPCWCSHDVWRITTILLESKRNGLSFARILCTVS